MPKICAPVALLLPTYKVPLERFAKLQEVPVRELFSNPGKHVAVQFDANDGTVIALVWLLSQDEDALRFRGIGNWTHELVQFLAYAKDLPITRSNTYDVV
jgi:hypothetical protein